MRFEFPPAERGARKRAFLTGAGILCAGLLYGYVLVPLGVRVPCLFQTVTGWRCPGCGISRLCLDLLHGRFTPSYNWGLVLALPWGLWLLWEERTRRHPRAARVAAWALVAAMLLWGVARNLWGI